MFLNATADINAYIDMAVKAGPGVINPETFYSKQLLDTIRVDADQYVYYRLADASPIQEKADKLLIRRWAPLQAHTIPLVEGVPPRSDKGSVEKYELNADQYGRCMEFTDKVDFQVVDPVVAHYTKEYSLVAMETLDLLAKNTLLAIAQKQYAGGAVNFAALTPASRPSMTDLRLIVLSLKKALVKPRSNGRYHVIGSPEFYYDMISDPILEKYMTINQTTKTMYDNTKLVPMFDLEFYETFSCFCSAAQISVSNDYSHTGR
jgi:N4-gp56 family major capsid protein